MCIAALLCLHASLFSVASKSCHQSSQHLESGETEIGPSGQPPDKPERWMHGPLFCFYPEGEIPLWWTSIKMYYTVIMLPRGIGME